MALRLLLLLLVLLGSELVMEVPLVLVPGQATQRTNSLSFPWPGKYSRSHCHCPCLAAVYTDCGAMKGARLVLGHLAAHPLEPEPLAIEKQIK